MEPWDLLTYHSAGEKDAILSDRRAGRVLPQGRGLIAKDFTGKWPGKCPGKGKWRDRHNNADTWKIQKEKHLQTQ